MPDQCSNSFATPNAAAAAIAPIKVTFKAYAKEDSEKVKVFRNATFFFPRSDKLQK